MSKRNAALLTLTCAALALVLAALGAGARASRGAAARSAAQGSPQTFVLTDFGAVGDGVTDAGPALQAALDALAAAGGGTLIVPAGRYAIVTPVSKNFGGLTTPIDISGVPSNTEPAPPWAGGQELTRGLDLTSEFLPRTGEAAPAISIGGLRSITVRELAFVGAPDAAHDALITLLFTDVGEAVVRHNEFYGLASLDGAMILANRSSLKIERSVFLGCTTNSGTYSSVVQNLEWKGVSVSDTIFADYGQRPELFGKTGLAAPFSWVNIGNAAAVDNESPRREAVFRSVFFDEGGLSAISAVPSFYEPPSAPIDLLYISTLRMNVSNLRTSGLYLTEPRGVLIEDGRFGWSTLTETAVNLIDAGSAIISRIECDAHVSTVSADAATERLVVIDAACPVIDSQAPYTRVFNAATPDDDPVRYVTSRFQTALGRSPDPAAHYYWADRILRCDAGAACVASARAALAAYLASNPQPTFTLEGRATDETGEPVENVRVTLSGSQAIETFTDDDGRYHFDNLPTSGVYTVAAEKRHYTFTTPQQTVTTPAGGRTVNFPATAERHQIGGRLADDAARGIAGATVTLSGTRSATATTDANGYYAFNALPAGGAYTVTPSSARYSFTPASLAVEDLEADEFLAFNARPLFYTISGQVLSLSGGPLGGVAVSLGGSKVATTTTNSQGIFSFADVPRGGNYTVTPGPTVGYVFAPASLSFNNLASDQGGTYTGTPTNYRLTGRVTSGGSALSGVAVNVTGSQAASATTDSGGNYSLTLPANGTYTVTPTRRHYTFAPASTTINPLASDRAADFTATLNRHRISGRVTRANGQAMAGVAVALSGSQSATATTDSNGDYSFTNLPAGGNYTVTPTRAGYDFNPATRVFNDLAADQSAPFTVTPSSFNIAGRVTVTGGTALSGVTVTLSGARSATTTTDSNGNYSLAVTSEGTYTVTPSKQHYTFASASQTFTDPLSNKTADFTATVNRHRISGRVARANGQAMSGVTVTLSGSQTATATTDASGGYSFTNLPAGSDYTVTPTRAGYDFNPKSKSFAGLGADQTGDFTVTPANVSIAGRVTSGGAGVAGATVTLSGAQTGTRTTDANGAYSFTVSSEGAYTVTPSLVNYTFAPASLSFTNPTADRAADFNASVNRHTISGRVTKATGGGLPGAIVTLSGSQAGTATTDSNGNYSLTGIAAGGNYTVTASKANYTVAPASATFSSLASDRTADFTATVQNLNIAGRVTVTGGAGLSGVTVTLSGARSATATTDSNGAYSFTVPADADYTVTPSKVSYSFTPPVRTFNALDANKTADFAAALNRHTVRGRVADANNYGMSGVIVTLSGSKTGTATTDSNGDFSFPNLDANGNYTVTPSAPLLSFAPASQTFAALGADAYATFIGSLARYRIVGRVTENGAGLGGVTVTLAGAHPALGPVGGIVTTGADGAYSFEALAGGNYAVMPSKKNYSFGPAQSAFAALASDRAADFNATPLPTFEFDAANYTVSEDGGVVTITVRRTGDASTEVTVVYHALGDTARRGADFIASIGQLTFAPGETSKTFSVFITDDAFVEDQEGFKLMLEPGEGASDAVPAPARVTITDNDASPAVANPIDDDEFFVRQHYRDFFSREPDAEGLAFWTGEIRKCGADAACREARRVSVSAAFFLSIEFQETGYLVYRLYKTAYGRAPERVEEFMLDARVMGEGVVVGRPGWQQVLEANKESSVLDFVGRAEFEASYPTTMTPAEFVDSLFANAGVVPTAAERQAALDAFGGAAAADDPAARASALRRVAEAPALTRAETNRAFVLMQYFGYLRRNPDEAPDADLTGYNNWLGKLIQFGGDYERAEMVKAFLSATEYRGRFGN